MERVEIVCYDEEKVKREDDIDVSISHMNVTPLPPRGASRMTSRLGKIVIFGISIASVSGDCSLCSVCSVAYSRPRDRAYAAK